MTLGIALFTWIVTLLGLFERGSLNMNLPSAADLPGPNLSTYIPTPACPHSHTVLLNCALISCNRLPNHGTAACSHQSHARIIGLSALCHDPPARHPSHIHFITNTITLAAAQCHGPLCRTDQPHSASRLITHPNALCRSDCRPRGAHELRTDKRNERQCDILAVRY